MKTTIVEDLFLWSVFQADRNIDFNGFYLRRPAGGVLVDPMPLGDADLAWLGEQAGGVQWILLTGIDHLRASEELRTHFSAMILAPETDREALRSAGYGAAYEWFGEGAALPEDLAEEIEVFWLGGGKTSAEAAFYLASKKALLFGDAVRSHVSGVLRLLPDAKIADRNALQRDVARLVDLDFSAVLLGDGDCLFRDGRAAFAEAFGAAL